jgi:cell fate regulator YaaT (PSP1 superfamily)
MIEHNQPKDPYVVGLRFQKVGKVYHFNAQKFRNIKPGDFVVVETSRGVQLGQVIQIIESSDGPAMDTIKPILRPATPQDLVMRQVWQQKETEAVDICREKVRELGLVDVKIIAAEYSFDGSRLYFLFSSEAGEKADLRSLRRAMQRMFQAAKVEMHLIGPRDVAKLLGGMGACGLEHRCCSAFLTEFSPISIKMAKEQGISLTPTEITGMCGRLRCCLVYEYEQYLEARKLLPKRGKWVKTPSGDGRVVDIFPLKESVMVAFEQGTQREFLKDEIQIIEEHEGLRIKLDTGPEKLSPEPGDYIEKGKKKGRGNSSN